MNIPETVVHSYRNFFVKTVSRSLQTAYKSITDTPIVTHDVQDRGLAALEFAPKPQIAPTVWYRAKELFLILSPKMEQSGRWDEWYPYLEQGVKMSIAFSDQRTEGELYLQIGILWQRRGHFQFAIERFEAAIACAKNVGGSVVWASGLNRLGFVAKQQHRLEEAVSYAEEALALIPENHAQRELSYAVLGMVSSCLREYGKAVHYFQRSLDICEAHGDQYQIAMRSGDLALALNHQGASQAAFELIDEAIIRLKRINAPVDVAINQMNLGIMYGSSGELQTALEYFAMAKPILEKVSNGFNLACLYNNQGYCYYKLQQWQDAERLYKVSLYQWQHLENWHSYANTLDGLGLVYDKQGRWDDAIRTFKEALQLLEEKVNKDECQHLFQEITANLEDVYQRSAHR